jgi:hypothetical protein
MSINWRKPLEWSTGEEASLAPYDNAYDGHRHVSGCKEWLNITGDNYVAVNATTGQVLGCEDDYPHIRNVAEPKNPPVWLHLFHGRSAPDEKLEDWGFNGPTIGPLDYVHVTYMCDVRYGFQNEEDAAKFGLSIEGHFPLHGDLVEHKGAFYGDFSINAFKPTGLYRIDLIEKCDPDEVIQSEKFDGTELEAEQRLGEVWNSSICATGEAGRYKAELYCISGGQPVLRQTIEPEGDDD